MSRKPVPARTGEPARLEVLFDKPQLLGRLFGEFDQNLVAIENRFGVYVAARGNRIQIEGEAEAIGRARDVLTGLYNRLAKGQDIEAGDVSALIGMAFEPTLEGIIRDDHGRPPVMIRTRKKTIVPRSATQIAYIEALNRNDIIFALGPAGTGKTYLAVAQAVSQLIGRPANPVSSRRRSGREDRFPPRGYEGQGRSLSAPALRCAL
jgi:phosphate starvation-inducible protein PhoH and related proteins